MTNINTYTEFVTPALAKAYLAPEINVNNRPVSATARDSYARDMLNGDWAVTGNNAIIFDNEGHLLDGQHRLSALASLEGKIAGVEMEVRRGFDRSVVGKMDVGYKRSVGAQHYMMTGEKMNPSVVSAVKIIMAADIHGLENVNEYNSRFTTSEQHRWISENPDQGEVIRSFLSAGQRSQARKPTVLAAIYTILAREDGRAARTFSERVADRNCMIGHPTRALGELFVASRVTGRGPKNVSDTIKATLLAWEESKQGRGDRKIYRAASFGGATK